jgi:hypothetical protein
MKVPMKVLSMAVSVLTSACLLQPKAVSETEEHDLAQLMAKAGQENEEVSGDEDDEDVV